MNHSGSIWPSIYSFNGATAIEVHITLHKKAFGPDVNSSLDLDELKKIADARHLIVQENPVNKNKISQN